MVVPQAGTAVRPHLLGTRNGQGAVQVAAEQVITETQRAAVAAAHSEARQLTQAALRDAGVTTGADVVRLPLAAMQDLIGVLGDGSPLRGLLNRLGQQAAQDVGDALTHAVTVGRNPRRTARDIRDALGGDLNRALTIARTEQMRAYRSASLRNYQANSDILRGWQWRATPSRRTCPVCLAMDGTEHGLDDPFASHQCCRCCPVPLLRDRETPPRETGAEWFANQDAATQRAMLGPGKQQLYAEGKLTLADLVGERHDPTWGKSRYQRSLREIQAGTHALSLSSGAGGSGGAGAPSAAPNPNPGRFATLAEATAWATQQYPHITWDFEGAHIDAINPTLDQFERLAQQWPEVAARLKYVGTYQGTNALHPHTWKPIHYAHADGGALGRGEVIGFNPMYYSDSARFLSRLQNDLRAGFHPKGCDTIESVLTHEFGHLVEVWLRSRRDSFRAIVDDDGFGRAHVTFQLWMNANKATEKLSRYARTKAVEAWASGFAAVYHMPRREWPIFVQRQAKLITMVRRRISSYKVLRDLPPSARRLARKTLRRDRKLLGIK